MCRICIVTLMISTWLQIYADDLRHRTVLHAGESGLCAAARHEQAKKALGYPRLSRFRYSKHYSSKSVMLSAGESRFFAAAKHEQARMALGHPRLSRLSRPRSSKHVHHQKPHVECRSKQVLCGC